MISGNGLPVDVGRSLQTKNVFGTDAQMFLDASFKIENVFKTGAQYFFDVGFQMKNVS